MDKRKGIILAIVLFLIIGLGTFVFAGGSDNNENGQGNNTNETNKNNENGQNVETPKGEEGENEWEGGNNNNNNNTNSVAGGGQGQAQTPDVETPNVPTNDNRANLLAALQSIQKMIDEATSKDAIGSARDARTEDLVTQVTNLNDEELNTLLEEINRVLNDTESPVIMPKDLDGSFNNKPVSITIKDDTKTTVKITMIDPNGDEVEVTEELTNLTLEGTYNLEVTDEAFNTTKIAFTIDSSNPTMNVANTHHFNSKEDAIIEIKDFTLDRVLVTNQDTKETFTLYDEDNDGLIVIDLTENKDATYHIYTYDLAGNEKDYWVAVDTTDADVIFTVNGNEVTDYSKEDVILTVFDKFLTEVTILYPNGNTNVYKLENGDFDKASGENRTFTTTLTEEGKYIVSAKDKVGNVTTKEIEIDTNPIEVDHLYLLNNSHNDFDSVVENRYKVIGNNQDLYVELVLKEQFDSIPTITIGNSEEISLTCKVASWDSKLFKCDAHITIDENMGLKNGEALTFEIKGVFDKAGNETTLDETYYDGKDFSTSKYGEVIYDNEAPVYNKLTILNVTHLRENNAGGNEDITLVNVGDEIRILFNFKEKLLIEPVIKIGDIEKTLKLNTNYNSFGKYTYYADIKVTNDMFDADGELNFEITDYADIAGNTLDEPLTLNNVDRAKYSGVIVDTTPANIKLYKWFNDENHQLVKPGRHNYCVIAYATDENGVKSFTLNNKEHENGTLICDMGSYELNAIDNAGNSNTITFEIDTDYADLYINDDVYSNSDQDNIHYYGKIDNLEIKGAEGGIVRLIDVDGNRIVDEKYSESAIEKIKEKLNVAGYYDFHIIDNAGNNTYVKIFTDGLDPDINSASVKSTNEKVTINVEDEQTHVASPQTFDVKNGYTNTRDVIIKVNVTDNYGLDKICFTESDSCEDGDWIDLSTDGNYNYTLVDSNEELKTINIFVKDFGGNITKSNVEITYDITPATLVQKNTDKVIKSGETYYYNGRFDATAVDENGILVKTTNNKIRDNISVSGLNQSYTFVVVDNAGNVATYNVILESNKPYIKGTGLYGDEAIEFVSGNKYREVNLKITDTNLETVLLNNIVKCDNQSECNIIENKEGLYNLKAIDKAGNSKEVSFEIDRTNPTYNYLSFRVDGDATSGVKTYYANANDILYVSIATSEKLSDDFRFVITDSEGNTFETPNTKEVWNNKDKNEYVYQAYVNIPENLVDGKLTASVKNVVDLAGNEADKTLKSDKVVLDRIDPDIIIQKNGKGDNLEPDKYNFCVTVKAEDLNGIEKLSIKNGEHEYVTGEMLCTNGTYLVSATDVAGNNKEIKFEIDSTFPIVNINGTDYENGTKGIRVDTANVKIIEQNVVSLVVEKDGEVLTQYGKNTLEFTLNEKGNYKITVRDKEVSGNKTVVEFYVGKYDSSIKFTIPDNIVYDGKPVDDIKVEVVDSNGDNVADPYVVNYYKNSHSIENKLNGAPTDAGTYVIAASYRNDDGDYEEAWNSATFTIEKATPTIEISDVGTLIFNNKEQSVSYEIIGVNGNDIKDELETYTIVTYKDRDNKVELTNPPKNIGNYSITVNVYKESNNYTTAVKYLYFNIVEEEGHETKFNAPLASNGIYYKSIPYNMYDEDGIAGIYFDLEGVNGKSYATCNELVAAVGDIRDNQVRGYFGVNRKDFVNTDEGYVVPKDYEGTVSVCVEDIYGNRVFFNNISIYVNQPIENGIDGVANNPTN